MLLKRKSRLIQLNQRLIEVKTMAKMTCGERKMETYKFHFNTQYAADLRDAVNDRPKQSIDNEHKEKQTRGSYIAWNRTCAAMDRLEDTLSYLNSIELGKNKDTRSAFDFYDFINNAYIVIDCIKTIGRIFRIDNSLIEEIEKSSDVFGKRLSEKRVRLIGISC